MRKGSVDSAEASRRAADAAALVEAEVRLCSEVRAELCSRTSPAGPALAGAEQRQQSLQSLLRGLPTARYPLAQPCDRARPFGLPQRAPVSLLQDARRWVDGKVLVNGLSSTGSKDPDSGNGATDPTCWRQAV